MDYNKTITKMKELAFGAEKEIEMLEEETPTTDEDEKNRVAIIEGQVTKDFSFELSDEIVLADGVELDLENGMYVLKDGKSFIMADGFVTEYKEEVVEEEEEMSAEIKPAVDENHEMENILEAITEKMNKLESKVSNLETEKVEMSSQLKVLNEQPAIENENENKFKREIQKKENTNMYDAYLEKKQK